VSYNSLRFYYLISNLVTQVTALITFSVLQFSPFYYLISNLVTQVTPLLTFSVLQFYVPKIVSDQILKNYLSNPHQTLHTCL